MKETRKIADVELFNRLFALAYSFQNRGLGDTFFDYSGHVNYLSIRLCVGGFKGVYEFNESKYCYNSESMQELFDSLDSFLRNLPETLKAINEKKQQAERVEYERLRAKFEEVEA